MFAEILRMISGHKHQVVSTLNKSIWEVIGERGVSVDMLSLIIINARGSNLFAPIVTINAWIWNKKIYVYFFNYFI